MEKERAVEILHALLLGADPRTGEVLPAESPCRREETARALALAIDGLSPPKPPARAGEPWTRVEEARLIGGYGRGLSPKELARAHGRTTGAIRSRLIRLGLLSAPEAGPLRG